MRPMTLRAVCFDYGGTLDGPASHWLDRFLALYATAGLRLSFERFRPAFDYATQRGYIDPTVAAMDLQQLVEFHVARQLEHLGIDDAALAMRVVTAFVDGSRAALADSRALLERLHGRVALGVISNFYGNVQRILDDVGMTRWLATIVDSGRVGVSKPDPRIFALAVAQLRCTPADVLYVGDSFSKDVVGAHAAGLRTAWLAGNRERPCPAPELMDVRLRSLDELDALIA